jgi:glyoxylase-like metal-dependent hydrolase (beta-lactamase superfamily II)
VIESAGRAIAAAPLLLTGCVLLTGCGTLPSAPPHANVAPQVRAAPFDVCWVEFATDKQPAGYGLAGSSDEEQWDVTFSGLLLRHPSGHMLLDAGQSSHFDEEVGSARFFPGVLLHAFQGGGTLVARAPDALRNAGEEPSALKAIALSHIHGDHAGGTVDLPGTPVLLSPDEIAFMKREKDSGGFDVIQAQEQSIEGRAKPIAFTKTPYENFDESADYFGDGSVVFVPLPGHTPGSIGTFVNRSPTQRFFHVGDGVNTLEAVEKRRSKSVVLGMTDHDGAAADLVAAKIGQLHAQDPALVILPAHDRKAWLAAFGAPGKCLRGDR